MYFLAVPARRQEEPLDHIALQYGMRLGEHLASGYLRG
jgi:hypothetical protein